MGQITREELLAKLSGEDKSIKVMQEFIVSRSCSIVELSTIVKEARERSLEEVLFKDTMNRPEKIIVQLIRRKTKKEMLQDEVEALEMKLKRKKEELELETLFDN